MTARKAETLHLTPGMSMAEGLQAMIGNGLGHLTGNLQGLDAGEAEAVHQMRVAIRRLRSALVLFDGHLQPKRTRRLSNEMRRFGRILAPARDWDVFLLETLPDAIGHGTERPWLELLVPPAEAARRRAYVKARKMVDEAEFTGFVPTLTDWSKGDPWAVEARRADLPGQKLSDHAAEMLDRLAAKAHKRGRHLPKRSMEELHALRKTMKKLRYGVEFLAGLYSDEESRPFRRASKSLLNLLGLINDTDITEQIVSALADGGRSHLAPAISLVSRRAHARREEALERLPDAWAKFEDVAPFWR